MFSGIGALLYDNPYCFPMLIKNNLPNRCGIAFDILHKTWNWDVSRWSRATTAKKCTKKRDPRAKLFYLYEPFACLPFSLSFIKLHILFQRGSRAKKRDWLGDRFIMPRNASENFTNSTLASLIFPYLAMGVNNNPIFGQWRHCFAFTPRVSRPGDSVCYCSLWTMVCVCWVFAEDLTGEQAYIFLFKRAISVLFYVVATSTRIPIRWNRMLDICVNTNSVSRIRYGFTRQPLLDIRLAPTKPDI